MGQNTKLKFFFKHDSRDGKKVKDVKMRKRKIGKNLTYFSNY